MNPLLFPCPRCHAPEHVKCKSYAGKGIAPHRQRLQLSRGERPGEKAKPIQPQSLFTEGKT